MALIGADPGQLEELARQVLAMAGTLGRAQSSLNGQLRHAPWRGAAADRFRQDWAARYSPAMLRAAAALRDAEATLRRNAQEQRVASGDRISASAPDSGAGSLYHQAQSKVAGVEHKGSSFLHGLEHDAKSGLHAVEHEASSAAHATQKAVHQVQHDVQQVGHDVAHDYTVAVRSQAFQDAIGGLEIVSAVAPFVLPPPAGLALAAGAAGLALGMDVARMANTGKWDRAALASETMSFALSATGAGVAIKAAEAARLATTASVALAGADTVDGAVAAARVAKVADQVAGEADGVKTTLERTLWSGKTFDALPLVEKGVVSLRSVQAGFNVGDHAYESAVDFSKGDTAGGVANMFGVVTSAAGVFGGNDTLTLLSRGGDTVSATADARSRILGPAE